MKCCRCRAELPKGRILRYCTSCQSTYYKRWRVIRRSRLPKVAVIHRVIWPQDWNRPLSREEQEIAKRLDTAPDFTRMAPAAQSWHSPLGSPRQDASLLQPEEA